MPESDARSVDHFMLMDRKQKRRGDWRISDPSPPTLYSFLFFGGGGGVGGGGGQVVVVVVLFLLPVSASQI